MDELFKKIVEDKDVSHLSIGFTEDHEYSVLIKMYDDQVANCYRFSTLDDVIEWMEEECGNNNEDNFEDLL